MSYKLALGKDKKQYAYRSFETFEEATGYKQSVFRNSSDISIQKVQESANSRFLNNRALDRKQLTVMYC